MDEKPRSSGRRHVWGGRKNMKASKFNFRIFDGDKWVDLRKCRKKDCEDNNCEKCNDPISAFWDEPLPQVGDFVEQFTDHLIDCDLYQVVRRVMYLFPHNGITITGWFIDLIPVWGITNFEYEQEQLHEGQYFITNGWYREGKSKPVSTMFLSRRED